MAVQKKAKAPEPAGESAPMWIVSFADLVTLLMSFFVVLYAMKEGGSKQQMEQMAAFKATFDPEYTPSEDSPLEWQIAWRKYKGLPGPPFPNNGGMAQQPTDGATGRDPTVQTIRAGKLVSGGRILFPTSSATIDPKARETIAQVFELLKGRTNVLLIKGHASADELIARPDDPKGRTLSYIRALAVCDALEQMGIDPRVLRPVPCGITEPAKTGVYDAEQQQLNRRVEVYATDNTIAEFSVVPTVPAASSGGHGAIAGAEEKPDHAPPSSPAPRAPAPAPARAPAPSHH